jgi:hypothetical protein
MTQELAEEALLGAHIRFDYAAWAWPDFNLSNVMIAVTSILTSRGPDDATSWRYN